MPNTQRRRSPLASHRPRIKKEAVKFTASLLWLWPVSPPRHHLLYAHSFSRIGFNLTIGPNITAVGAIKSMVRIEWFICFDLYINWGGKQNPKNEPIQPSSRYGQKNGHEFLQATIKFTFLYLFFINNFF
ncbi:MAG: hypothetical protein KC445_07040, partial [Anaerolineales bacterium]|nr:hypothetical protein [Anaerolineales bacterium]